MALGIGITEPKDRLVKARVQLLRRNPFFAYLTLKLQFVEGPQITSTACVTARRDIIPDGKDKNGKDTFKIKITPLGELYYNPEFIKTLTDEEVLAVLCHEVCHPAFLHLTRIGSKDEKIWNLAIDLKVNGIIAAEGFSLPKNTLIPVNDEYLFGFVTIKKIKDKTAEEIYDELEKHAKKCKDESGGFDEHGFGKPGDGDGDGEGDGEDGTALDKKMSQAEKDWKQAITEAATFAKHQGKLPAGIERMVDELQEEKLPWKQILLKYVQNVLPADYTWARPNRRSVSCGVYLPSMTREGVDLVISIDTSGSIGQSELCDFLSEVVGIRGSFNGVTLTALICDAVIHGVVTLNTGDDIQDLLKAIKGGGGTSHIPVFNWMEENKPTTKLHIAFTDGYTDFPRSDLGIPTVWVMPTSSKSIKVPFGDTVFYEPKRRQN